MCLRLFLTTWFLDADRRHALQLVAEMIAHRGLQHLVDEVEHRADDRDHLRGFGIGNMDLNLQIDIEDEALFRLGGDLVQVLVEIVRRRGGVRPVEGENERRDDLDDIAARIDRVLYMTRPSSCQFRDAPAVPVSRT